MSKFYKLSALLTAFLIISSNLYSQGFNSVSSSNGVYVIAAGDQGVVWRSSNGGTSWESFNIGTIKLTSVSTYGNYYWITGEDGKIYFGDVLIPGVITPMTIDVSTALKGSCFLSQSIGYVCGADGKVYKTTNGSTWTLANNGILSTVTLNSISFYDANDGIAVGSSGFVYKTNNGGSTWQLLSTGTAKNLKDVKYFSGYALITGEYGTLLEYNGSSINPINSRILEDIRAVSGTSQTDIHIAGGGGFIRNNKTGSSLFLNFEKNPMLANLVDIHFNDANTGYAVSSLNKAIIKTIDGGTSWSLSGGATMSFTSSPNLFGSNSGGIGNGLYRHPQNRDAVFICQGTKVFRSNNRGLNWVQIATVTGAPGSCHSFYVNSTDTNIMLASMGSSGGKVMRSTDYGQTWLSTWGPGPLTAFGMPMELNQNTTNEVFLSPDNSVMLKSTNFGLTWTPHSSNTFTSPCDITIQHGNSNIMYLGDSGPSELWKSTNGGLTWTLKQTQSTSEIPMIGISQLDTNLSIHTYWSSFGTYRTTDQWESSSNVSTTSSAWGCDISQEDPTVLGFATYGGQIHISTNGGNNFVSGGSLVSSNAGFLAISRADLLVQSSSGIQRVNIAYNSNATPVTVTGIPLAGSVTPSTYALHQNYPNPFNPETTIRFDLPEASDISIKLYDISGRELYSILSGFYSAGTYSINFNASRLPSGTYLYSLSTPNGRFIKKMSIIK